MIWTISRNSRTLETIDKTVLVTSYHRSHSPIQQSTVVLNITNSTAGQSTNHNEKVRLLLSVGIFAKHPAAVEFIFESRSINDDKKTVLFSMPGYNIRRSPKFAFMKSYEFLYSDVFTAKFKLQLNSSFVDCTSTLSSTRQPQHLNLNTSSLVG